MKLGNAQQPANGIPFCGLLHIFRARDTHRGRACVSNAALPRRAAEARRAIAMIDDFKIFECARDDAAAILKQKDNFDYRLILYAAEKEGKGSFGA